MPAAERQFAIADSRDVKIPNPLRWGKVVFALPLPENYKNINKFK